MPFATVTPLYFMLLLLSQICTICIGFSSSYLPPLTFHTHHVSRIKNNDHGKFHQLRTRQTSKLRMGLLDFIQNNFLDSREGDFIPLEKDDSDNYGPGPLILVYAVPQSMDNEELLDMIEDGMPNRNRNDINMQRLTSMDKNGFGGDNELLDVTVEEALNLAMDLCSSSSSGTTIAPIVTPAVSTEQTPCPVLYFSGVSNTEMMDSYNIIANEIYEETLYWPACAKVVPPAMNKSMRQVLTEISGDHEEAMKMRREEAEREAKENEE